MDLITLLLWRPELYVAQKFSLHFSPGFKVMCYPLNVVVLGDAETKFFEGETELMACGEVTGPDKDDS